MSNTEYNALPSGKTEFRNNDHRNETFLEMKVRAHILERWLQEKVHMAPGDVFYMKHSVSAFNPLLEAYNGAADISGEVYTVPPNGYISTNNWHHTHKDSPVVYLGVGVGVLHGLQMATLFIKFLHGEKVVGMFRELHTQNLGNMLYDMRGRPEYRHLDVPYDPDKVYVYNRKIVNTWCPYLQDVHLGRNCTLVDGLMAVQQMNYIFSGLLGGSPTSEL